MPLRQLDSPGAQVSHIPSLKEAKINNLNLFKTSIEEINYFDCHALEEIVLSGSPIKSIAFLSDAKKLLKAEIRATPVSDLSPLANTSIMELYLPGSQVKSIDCLAYLPIETLNIIGLELEDINCLSTLPLKSLSLSPELLKVKIMNSLLILKFLFCEVLQTHPNRPQKNSFKNTSIQ